MPVHYERRGAAALVTIERQERRNAVDGPTADLLGAAYDRFEADDDARVMVLTGAGDVAFCAGADLKALETLAPRLDDPRGPLGFTRLTPSKPAIVAVTKLAKVPASIARRPRRARSWRRLGASAPMPPI